jgi:two-component system response regulator
MDEQKEESRILIIEDNPDDSFFLTRQLRRARLDDHVTVIADGRQALNFLLKNSAEGKGLRFVAIFLDLRLPSLDGVPLLRELRAVPHLADIPVIVMTSSNEEKDLEECRKLAVKAYVTKPVSLTEFIRSVAHVFPPVPQELETPAA